MSAREADMRGEREPTIVLANEGTQPPHGLPRAVTIDRSALPRARGALVAGRSLELVRA